jgi:uncharacterized protein (DUF362 family)
MAVDKVPRLSPLVLLRDTRPVKKDSILGVLDGIMSDRDSKSFSKVVVKPNLMDPQHTPGVTTAPDVLEIIVAWLRDRYEDVTIVEAGGYNFLAEKAFKGHDVHGICARTGATAVDLCDLEKVKISTESRWGHTIDLPLPRILLDQETCVLSLACMKTHVFTGVSLSIKNLWGCVPDRKRTLLHPYINEALAKIVSSIPNARALIDGSVALDGRGPKMGRQVEANTVIGSRSLLAADIVATSFMGIDVGRIEHIRRTMAVTGELRGYEDYRLEGDLKSAPHDQMRATRNWFDSLAIAIYWSPSVCNLVYNSRLTALIQYAVRKSGLSPGAQNYL